MLKWLILTDCYIVSRNNWILITTYNYKLKNASNRFGINACASISCEMHVILRKIKSLWSENLKYLSLFFRSTEILSRKHLQNIRKPKSQNMGKLFKNQNGQTFQRLARLMSFGYDMNRKMSQSKMKWNEVKCHLLNGNVPYTYAREIKTLNHLIFSLK